MKEQYKLIQTKEMYKVVDNEGFAWGQSPSIKGAIISSMNCGVRLRSIDFNGHYVPVKECIEAVK